MDTTVAPTAEAGVEVGAGAGAGVGAGAGTATGAADVIGADGAEFAESINASSVPTATV